MKKQESGHYEPPHSLFGIIGETARATGWSVDYILKLDYVTLMMIQMDVPRYVDKPKMTPEEIVRYFEKMDKARNKGKATDTTVFRKGIDPMNFFTNYAAK